MSVLNTMFLQQAVVIEPLKMFCGDKVKKKSKDFPVTGR
jgi:hypothetical protein